MVDRTTQYALDVANGKIDICEYVKLSCRRHINDLKRQDSADFPYIFDEKRAEKFFKFTRFMRHYKGPLAGQRLELLPWQCFVLGSIYGWVEKQTGNFRFKEVYIEVPRKSGKSFMAAGIALYDMICLEKTGAEVYLAATKMDQAKLVFNDAVAIIKSSSELQPYFELLLNNIYSKEAQRTSFVRPLGSDSKKLDGLNPVTAIFDEVHAIEDRNIIDVIKGAFGARKNYHTVSITTAGVNRNGICYENREQLIKILQGHFINERKFGVIYTLDEADLPEWDTERVWLKSNPSLGHGKQIDFMRDEANNARQVPTQLSDFMTKQLCVWLDAKSSWLGMDDWKSCEETIQVKDLKGKRCWVGMDLSRVDDLSVLVYLFPAQKGISKPYAFAKCYLPADTIKDKEHKHGAPYSSWSKAGFLTLTPGNTVDHDFIRDDLMRSAEEFDIQSVIYDRYFAGELVDALKREGINLEGFAQNFINYNGPTLELERLIKSKAIQFEKSPLFAWQASNVTLARDSTGNVKPTKDRGSQKIDAIVALIMTISNLGKADVVEEPMSQEVWASLFN